MFCSLKLNVGGVFSVKLKPPTFGGSLDTGALTTVLLPPNWNNPDADDGVDAGCGWAW